MFRKLEPATEECVAALSPLQVGTSTGARI